ncbi:MFS transporter [Alloyangia pacifica]|uniref:Predicted arabinose efflux permease, MFS family n=1 Tax=Alloyangia pacifica TaxID=311180 RepID=A0A1I6VUT9_9RHOB|nr:MFS transporter [Alloyangia pacifica]SDI25212.1 Predicted arabinose efflux permease, MFS family [Alloyangia pacifica]SFT17449.1 Predicted arabinose efflux permease, MFS family [Alloyangia pacifica]
MRSHLMPDKTTSARLPVGIWALGFVSLLMDVSSEMIHALLPVYLTVGLGASALALGVIEGIAEATAAITKVFSGALSDRIGRRKELAALGYGLAAVTKPVFPLAGALGWVIAARFIDRIGKGIRGAPRDALVADLAPPGMRGAAFGLRQSLDTVGAFLGPLAAIGLMWLFSDDFRSVFWIAVLPAFLSVGLLLWVVREPERPATQRKVRNPLALAELKLLGGVYWWVVVVATLFTLARFSEAFLILRAQVAGTPPMLVPLVLVGMNLVYALSAWPVGVLSDRIGRTGLLLCGLGLLIVADVVLALSPGLAGLAAGVLIWGLHMGFTQGLLAAMVAETVPAELRGTAFGMFNLVTGVALLLASLLAGALWEIRGPAATFLAGAAFAAISALGLLPLRGRLATAAKPPAAGPLTQRE